MAKEIQELKSLLGNRPNQPPPQAQQKQQQQQSLANTATGKDDKDVEIAALKQALKLVNSGGKKKDNPQQKKKFKNDLPNKGWGKERNKAIYPGSLAWCSSCGYDLHPDHNSKNCRYLKEGHQREATLQNQMGESQRNKHLCVNCN